jgi:hypothetical protein
MPQFEQQTFGGPTSTYSQSLPPGTAVQVRPLGDGMSQFGSWSCDTITGANRCIVTLTSDRTVTATFTR